MRMISVFVEGINLCMCVCMIYMICMFRTGLPRLPLSYGKTHLLCNLLYLAFLGLLLLLLASSSFGLSSSFGNLGSGVSDRLFGTILPFFHFYFCHLLPWSLLGGCIGRLDFGDWR
jgi:hypothetical protein